MTISDNLSVNIELLKKTLPIERSFDIIEKDLLIGGRPSYLIFVDGFAKDDVMVQILKSLQSIPVIALGTDPDTVIKANIPYIEAELQEEMAPLTQAVLSGTLALFVDGFDKALMIDAREYPARSPEESDTERVTRGSKDCFVETIVFNTALIRRRIRDTGLTFEMKTVGRSSKTDVCIGYIEGRADEAFLQKLRAKLDAIDVDALVMAEKSLEELLIRKKWFNPLPQMKYTQRPDIAASFLSEGHVAIIVDTSPTVMITPSTLFYFLHFAEDYFQDPIVGNYYRFIRITAFLVALILTPTWMLLAENSESLPEFLNFIGAKDEHQFSLLVQFLILELGFDYIKMSSMHTPTYLGGAFGILGGLLLGDFAIKVGFFVPETIFYMAMVAIASYCIPNVELTNAVRLFRLLLLICTGVFGFWGYVITLALLFIMALCTETMDKKRPYLWPLIPFNAKALSSFLIRKRVKNRVS